MKLQGMTVEELLALGLDVHDIFIHQERIQKSVDRRGELFIPIQETCRLDNQGIIPQTFLRSLPQDAPQGFVAFVPAAGAASRYFKPLHDLRQALSAGQSTEIVAQRQKLLTQDARSWPMPQRLTEFFAGDATSWDAAACQELMAEIDNPKALLPSWKDGPSFLQMKCEEHAALKGLDAQVFVAPLEQSARFRMHLDEHKTSLPTLFLEQGPSMSTIRFHNHGLPYRDSEEKLTLVPAGHGMLVKLFPDIHRQFPQAHSLFIRNIDNVNGTEVPVRKATENFLVQHQTVLRALQEIRRSLHADQLADAARVASDLLGNFAAPRPLPPVEWVRELEDPWRPLWAVLLQILHCPASHAMQLRTRLQDKRALRTLYDRPLNTLGQVPNSGKDIGGTPVFAHNDGGEVSICLELPHVSPVDRQRFLEDATQATHFNPVFVAAEIPTHHHAYDLQNCPFWILAEKSYLGAAVVYHEIVLYEILGNSLTSNVLFPEIPRLLFHPHKTLTDGVRATS